MTFVGINYDSNQYIQSVMEVLNNSMIYDVLSLVLEKVTFVHRHHATKTYGLVVVNLHKFSIHS